MKNIFYLLLCLSVSTFAGKFNSKDFEGDWHFFGTSTELTEDRTQWLVDYDDYIMHLDPSGKYHLDRGQKDKLVGTWSFKNNAIILKRTDGSFVNVIYSFDGSKLITSETHGEMTAYTYYQKKR